MEVVVTSFVNPFSFFCIAENTGHHVMAMEHPTGTARTPLVSDFNHGQYVAVMWNDKWVRGIVTTESQFLIWLVDYGFYLRPNEKNVSIELPAEYKKHDTKVFEASLHGVIPVDRFLTMDGQMTSRPTASWTQGATEKAQTLISSAVKSIFVPIVILTTKFNDIVLGDLFLQLPDKKMVNLVDELELWPKFLERNPDSYIKDLSVHYVTRRKHRASPAKPELPGFSLSTVSSNMSREEYDELYAKAMVYEHTMEFEDSSEDGSTVVTKANRDLDDDYKLTPEEIEKYSRMFVNIHGTEYNVLNILLNKLRDLKMCEKYRDHDRKGVGRASYYRRACIDHEDFI